MESQLSLAVEADHEIRFQLNAGSIDPKAGIIRACTVAQAGVTATGKYVFLDKNGKLTRDPEQSVRKLPVVTDDATLTSLLKAAEEAGGVLKVRSDHSDDLQSRAGTADNFKLIGNRVVADLHLNDSYRDRDIVLETAQKTPKLIGLSIDFNPTFALEKDRALMRVETLYAVDIVDEGAVTHEGLFLKSGSKRGRVDTNENVETQQNLMAEPTLKEVLTAVQGLATQVSECQAGLKKMAEGEAPAVVAEDKEKEAEKKAADELKASLKAGLEEVKTTLAAVKEEQAKLSKEKAALGMRGGNGAGGGDAAAESEAERLAAEKAKGEKTFLQLVSEAKADTSLKLTAGGAHSYVMKKHPEKYAAHLKGKGVVTG